MFFGFSVDVFIGLIKGICRLAASMWRVLMDYLMNMGLIRAVAGPRRGGGDFGACLKLTSGAR